MDMGNALTSLFGRHSKLPTLLHHSITRTALLHNRYHSLLLVTTSDVVELLKLGYTKQAILRVEHVIKSNNMLETLSILESYCDFLVKRVSLIEKNKDCPEEVYEAISSLIFASSRIGEFPELVHIQEYFEAKFGKEYVSQCIQFPLYSNVNEKIVQYLSRRKPSLETRLRFLREIAAEHGININLDVDFRQAGEEKGKQSKLKRNKLTINQVLDKSGY